MENLEKIINRSVDNFKTPQLIEFQLLKHFEYFQKITGEKDLFSFFSLCQILWLTTTTKLDCSVLEKEYVQSQKLTSRSSVENSIYFSQLKNLLENPDKESLISGFCSFYENCLKREHRVKLGAFYTPLAYCIKAYDQFIPIEKSKTTYDPFCGGGAWLCAFLIKRKSKMHKVDAPPVFGTDIDKNAVFLARLNTSFLLSKNDVTFSALCEQIRVVDTLYQSDSDSNIVKQFMQKCSFVATNPPYGFAVDSKNSCFDTNLERVPDKEVFYYAIDKIRSILPAEKEAHFLIPNTFLFNLGSKDFKKHLSERFEISVCDHTKENLFASATVRTALLSLSKKRRINTEIKYSLGFGSKTKRLNDLEFIEGKFKDANLNCKLLSLDTIPLNSLFEVSQGLIPYDKYRGHTKYQIENRVYHSPKKASPEHKRELQGKDVSPFSVKWSGENWIKYGDWLAAPRAPKFFRESRVLIREITHSKTGQLNCCYTDQEFYNTPSIINVIFRGDKKNAPIALKTLAVLISSSLYAEYHLQNSPKAMKGVFPKILVNDVRNLPLPDNFLDLDLSRVYDRAQKMRESDITVDVVLDYIEQNVSSVLQKKMAA